MPGSKRGVLVLVGAPKPSVWRRVAARLSLLLFLVERLPPGCFLLRGFPLKFIGILLVDLGRQAAKGWWLGDGRAVLRRGDGWRLLWDRA